MPIAAGTVHRPSNRSRLALLVAWPMVANLSACPAATERRAVDVGVWPVDQSTSGALAGFVVGDLEVQLGDASASDWRTGQASLTAQIEVPMHDRFVARGSGQFGATRSLGVAEEGHWYRTLYLAPTDAMLCFALPMSDTLSWTVPTVEVATSAGPALADCSWDVSGVRLHAAATGPAAFDWSLDLSAPRVHTTPVVDGEASVIDLVSGLKPGPHGLRIVARDAASSEIGAWPGSGNGRLLLLPALLDAVNFEIDFIQDVSADFEAPIAAGGSLLEITARYRGQGNTLYLRVSAADASVEAGDPVDVPALGTSDTIAVMLRAELADAPLVRAAIGRSGALSPGSTTGVSATSDGSDPWRTHITIETTALSDSPLGKSDLVRLCVHAYLEGGVTPRLPTAVWPSGCDIDYSQWAAVRLFSIVQ